jgi:hypothetical protein
MPQPEFEATRRRVIQEIIRLTREKYVYPEIGEQLASQLQANLDQGSYDQFSTPGELAARLTMELQSASADGHWFVAHDPQNAVDLLDPETENDQQKMARYLETARQNNYGFERLERLNGNIGYLDLRSFIPSEYAGETAAAAMNLLANSNALIIDLRRNHGGYPSMVQLITSYLFDEKPRHLNTFFYRPTGETQQFWTFPHVPGRRRPEIPVYLLISSATGSAAEEFAYNLKHMGRATLIGETTAGFAHPVTREVAAGEYVVRLPYGRPINPVTGQNWEGTGVEPHIPVPAGQALETAHLKAVEDLLAALPQGDPRHMLEWVAEIVRSEYHPVELGQDQLARFAGEYGKRLFDIQGGVLHAGHQEIPVSWPLVPISPTRFRLDEDMKFEFIVDEGGDVSAVKVTYRDGRPDVVSERTA